MSIGNTRWQRQLLVPALALGILAACGDSDDKDNDIDETVDAGKDAGGTEEDAGAPDAETDASVAPQKLTEIFAGKTALSADQADRFWTATFDADGKVLAGGLVTDVVAGTDPKILDKKFAVARFTVDGALD